VLNDVVDEAAVDERVTAVYYCYCYLHYYCYLKENLFELDVVVAVRSSLKWMMLDLWMALVWA
jgi:hypothetical protein